MKYNFLLLSCMCHQHTSSAYFAANVEEVTIDERTPNVSGVMLNSISWILIAVTASLVSYVYNNSENGVYEGVIVTWWASLCQILIFCVTGVRGYCCKFLKFLAHLHNLALGIVMLVAYATENPNLLGVMGSSTINSNTLTILLLYEAGEFLSIIAAFVIMMFRIDLGILMAF
jgi:hypothetical protein